MARLSLPRLGIRSKAIRDVTYQFTGENRAFVSGDEYPPRAPVGNIRARVNDANKLVINGSGNQLRELRFSSESRSLEPGQSAAPFTDFTENTSRRIRMSTPGFVTLEGDLTLDAGYNRQVGGEDVILSVREVGDFGLRFADRIDDYPAATQRINLSLNTEISSC